MFDLPARPLSDVTFPPGRDAVDVPFRLTADDRILVPLTVDGRRTVEAEFDSGGSLILQPSMLTALGITAQGREKQGGGGEGSSIAGTGRLAGITLGGATVRDVGFHSRALDPDHADRALVGLEVLQRFTVRFDFDRSMMTLTRPAAFSYAGTGAIVPFHFQDNQPEVHGSVDGIAGLFTIDTGDAGSLLLIAPFARRYGLVARYRADLPYDGKAITATHGVFARRRVGTVAFDGPDGRSVAEAHDPITRISLQHAGFDANRDVSANIGLGILKRFNVIFDYVRQRIILEPNRLHDQRDVFNRAGLRLKREGAAWTVTAVYPGTPAADAGLHAGDTVLRIDGGTADVVDAEALWGKLEGPLGTKVHLRLRSSAGAERDEVLTLRDLL